MAVTLGKSPVQMTAVNDAITGNWKVTTIRVVSTSGTGVAILTDNGGTHEIFHSRSLQASDAEESGALDYWVDGITVSQLPTGAIVHVYYE